MGERLNILLGSLPVVGRQEIRDTGQSLLKIGSNHFEFPLNRSFRKLVHRDAKRFCRFLKCSEGVFVLEAESQSWVAHRLQDTEELLRSQRGKHSRNRC